MIEHLLHKMLEKEAVVAVLGLGYTGLSLAHDFGHEGFKIIGFDIDKQKIEKLKRKESYLPFMPHTHLFSLIESGKFLPTENPKDLKEADILIIAVPSPLNNQRMPDISFIQKASEIVASHLRKDQLVIVQSTSFPGTTEEVVLPILEKTSGLTVGQDFYLAHVPEREDAGNPQAVLNQIPRICGGITRKCMLLAKTLYEFITVKVFPCSSAKVAEATKEYENTFRLINIAFVDEMKMVFDRMGINIWEVIDAASTKPFGFTAFYPGPAIGGECIPVDPIYLSWKAEQYGAKTSMIEAASIINEQISDYIVKKITDSINKRKKDLSSVKILLLGVAFKKDVEDIRESGSIRVLKMLREKGVSVCYHDFFVPELKELNLTSIQLTKEALEEADCVVILTDHSKYEWAWVCEHSSCVIDTRNATRNIEAQLKEKVIL